MIENIGRWDGVRCLDQANGSLYERGGEGTEMITKLKYEIVCWADEFGIDVGLRLVLPCVWDY